MQGNTDPCESQPHKGDLNSKLNSKTVPVLPSFLLPFHLLPSPVHLVGFSFYILLGKPYSINVNSFNYSHAYILLMKMI